MMLYNLIQEGSAIDKLKANLITRYKIDVDTLSRKISEQIIPESKMSTPVDVDAIFNLTKNYFANADLSNFIGVENLLTNPYNHYYFKFCTKHDFVASIFDILEACLQKKYSPLGLKTVQNKVGFLGFNSLEKIGREETPINIICQKDKSNCLCVYSNANSNTTIRTLYTKAKKFNHLTIANLLSFVPTQAYPKSPFDISPCGANIIYLLSTIKPATLDLINCETIDNEPEIVEKNIVLLSSTLADYYNVFWNDAHYVYANRKRNINKERYPVPYNKSDEILFHYRLERLFNRNFIYTQTQNYALFRDWNNPYKRLSVANFDAEKLKVLFFTFSKLPNIYSRNAFLTNFLNHSDFPELQKDYIRLQWLEQLTEVASTSCDLYIPFEGTFFYLLYLAVKKTKPNASLIEHIEAMYDCLNKEISNHFDDYVLDTCNKPFDFNAENKLLYQIISKSIIHTPFKEPHLNFLMRAHGYGLNNIDLRALYLTDPSSELFLLKEALLPLVQKP